MSEEKKATPRKRIFLISDIGEICALGFSIVVTAISVLYMINNPTFMEVAEPYVSSFEIAAATLAFLIYTLDRIGVFNKLFKFIKEGLYMATMLCFLVTIPHLVADNISKLNGNMLLFHIDSLLYLVVLTCSLWIFIHKACKKTVCKSFFISLLLVVIFGAFILLLNP